VADSSFQISRTALEAVLAHARERCPSECCGILIGSGTRIDEAAPARNLAEGPSRYLIDPADHIAARRAARSRGLEVVGFYHSHPHSAAWPSPTDLDEATYPEAVHLIVSLADGGAEARLFRIEPRMATELPLTTAP
jgi:[CysO sulfur-carrier protein]-S-L-cysteine hydrolase